MSLFSATHPRRTVNGKLYHAHSWSKSKSKLKRQAEDMRKKGIKARVVKFGKAWALYIR